MDFFPARHIIFFLYSSVFFLTICFFHSLFSPFFLSPSKFSYYPSILFHFYHILFFFFVFSCALFLSLSHTLTYPILSLILTHAYTSSLFIIFLCPLFLIFPGKKNVKGRNAIYHLDTLWYISSATDTTLPFFIISLLPSEHMLSPASRPLIPRHPLFLSRTSCTLQLILSIPYNSLSIPSLVLALPLSSPILPHPFFLWHSTSPDTRLSPASLPLVLASLPPPQSPTSTTPFHLAPSPASQHLAPLPLLISTPCSLLTPPPVPPHLYLSPI